MNKYYIKKQDGSIYNIFAKSPEAFLQDPENDILLSPENVADIADKQFWIEQDGDIVVDTTAKTNKEREDKLQAIRDHREPLLAEADVEINIIEDAAGDSSALRTYRQELRDMTEVYKADMSLLDAVTDVAVDITWPVKP